MNIQKPLPRKKLSDRYFNELKSGTTVPRNEKTGKLIPFKVGGNYTIVNETTKEELNARCTQDCPYHLVLLETTQEKPMFETGATSEAVNNLILFTDTTSQLAELRDTLYKDWVDTGNFGTSRLYERFIQLFNAACELFNKEFKHDKEICQSINTMTKGQSIEYCQLYVYDFENWKSEHGYK